MSGDHQFQSQSATLEPQLSIGTKSLGPIKMMHVSDPTCSLFGGSWNYNQRNARIPLQLWTFQYNGVPVYKSISFIDIEVD